MAITILVDWLSVLLLRDGTPAGFFTVVSRPFALFLFLIVAVPLFQRFVLAGRFRDREKLYSGFPIFWPVLRLFVAAKPRTRQEEEYFKRSIDPALALLFAFLVSSDDLWFVQLFFFIGGLSIFARESMIRSFYETNEINVEDAMIRTYQTAKAAGMRIASTRPTEGVLGQISPTLRQADPTETSALEAAGVGERPEEPPANETPVHPKPPLSPRELREQRKEEAKERAKKARERMFKHRR